MPNIIPKKINELLDGSAVDEPLFLIADQTGKAWNLTDTQLKDKLQKISFSATNIALGTNIDTVIVPGVYRIIRTNYNSTNYPNAPYFNGMLLSSKLGDVYLIVEQTPGGDIMQHMHIPFSDYAVYTRLAFPRHLSNSIREWYMSLGYATIIGETDSTGNPTARSLVNANEIKYSGLYSLYLTNYSNTVLPALLEMIGLPVPVGFTQGYAGYNFLKVEYGVPDYAESSRAAAAIKQTIFYSKLSIDINSNMHDIFTRNIDGIGNVLTSWRDSSFMGLSSVSANSQKSSDNTLKAGTSTIPPIVFSAGVQTQSPAVPGAWNYDGTDYYYTDSAGKKHKITSTIIT